MAFNDAMTDLETGRCEYAVVGGASGIFRPQTSIAFQRLHMMSPDVSKIFESPHLHFNPGCTFHEVPMLKQPQSGPLLHMLHRTKGAVQNHVHHTSLCSFRAAGDLQVL